MTDEEIKERDFVDRDVHAKLVQSLGEDQRNVFEFITGKYSYDPYVSWKCNFNRIIEYVHKNFKNAFDLLNQHVEVFTEENKVRLIFIINSITTLLNITIR